MHYYKFNIPDWALHTAHLDPIEEGVYFRLINYYYDTESPIPKETQSVLRRLRLGNHSDLVDEILAEFFILKDDFWHHKRCDLEIKAYHAKADANRANGKRGGRPRASGGKQKTQPKPKKTQPVISGNPNITLTKNQEPLTNNHNIICTEPIVSLPTNKYNTDGEAFPITADQVTEYQKIYPGVDVDQQLRSMRGWLISNQSKRKTYGGMARFINSWLAREQDRAGSKPKPDTQSTRDNSLADDLTDTSWAH